VSLEDAFWDSLKAIAAYQRITLSALLAAIDSVREYSNLSSHIRVFVINFYRGQFIDEQEIIRSTAHEAPLSPLQ
jgi:predicted DNA-binding ribbon-helix-helix protein